MNIEYLLITKDVHGFLDVELPHTIPLYILGLCLSRDIVRGDTALRVKEGLHELGSGGGYTPGEFTTIDWVGDNAVITTNEDIYGAFEQYTLPMKEFFKLLEGWDALMKKGAKSIMITRSDNTFTIEEVAAS